MPAAPRATTSRLDDWYARQLTEAEENIRARQTGTAGPNAPTEQQARDSKNEALRGLGQPADGGAAAKATQQRNARDKTKKDTHGSKEALKNEIKRISDALQECLKRCQPPAEQPPAGGTEAQPQPQTPVTEPPPAGQPVVPGGQGAAPAPNVAIPPLPECFETQRAKDDYIAKRDDDIKKQNERLIFERKKPNPDMAVIAQCRANIDALQAAIAAADNVPVCPPKGKGKTATGDKHGMVPPNKVRGEFCALIADNKIKVDFAGTGETSGHVADCKISNLTDQPVHCVIPPMILESRSGKNQDYACPSSQPVDVAPKETKTVPVEGVCLVRNKPPVGKDVTGDLSINGCEDGGRITDDHADDFISIAARISHAADGLLKDGSLKEIPYKDPKKKKDVVVQWATWMDPQISEMTKVPPATKEDLKKVVYKQVPGTMTPETKKKVDEGIDKIFESVELTTEKAKDLEKKAEEGGEEAGDQSGASDGLVTQQKPKKKKKWPKPVQDWWDKKKAARDADAARLREENAYKVSKERLEFLGKSKRYQELKEKAEKAREKAGAPGATQADKDEADKADKELQKQIELLDKDFQKTPAGKKAYEKVIESEKAAQKAHDAEKEAGKNVDKAIKEEVEKAEKEAEGSNRQDG